MVLAFVTDSSKLLSLTTRRRSCLCCRQNLLSSCRWAFPTSCHVLNEAVCHVQAAASRSNAYFVGCSVSRSLAILPMWILVSYVVAVHLSLCLVVIMSQVSTTSTRSVATVRAGLYVFVRCEIKRGKDPLSTTMCATIMAQRVGLRLSLLICSGF